MPIHTTDEDTTTNKLQRDFGETEKYRAKRPFTAPPSREPVHVVAGTAAIIILLSVVIFVVGNDITTLLCKRILCAPEKTRNFVKPKPKIKSYMFNYSCKAEPTGHNVSLCIILKSYESFLEINNKKSEFDVKAFKNGYIVQNGNNMDVWIKHMSLNLSQIEETGSVDNNVDNIVDGEPDDNLKILRAVNKAPTSAIDDYLSLNQSNGINTKESSEEQNDTDCDKSLQICKPIDTPIVATYVDPASKTAIKASYIGSTVSEKKYSHGSDTNDSYMKTKKHSDA